MADRAAQPRLIDARSAGAIAAAVSMLRAGGVIAMPTDTVYGFAAAVDRPGALERLYEVKRRPSEKAIPILLSDAADVERVARGLPPDATALARRFWPGGLTLVVEARAGLPPLVTSTDDEGTRTVALRVPDHPVALAIIAAAGGALAVTSANISGEAPALEARDIIDSAAAPDLVIDGGRVPGGVPSTIVRASARGLAILREGAVSPAAIRAALGQRDLDIESSPPSSAV